MVLFYYTSIEASTLKGTHLHVYEEIGDPEFNGHVTNKNGRKVDIKIDFKH